MVKRALCVGCNYPSKAFGLAGGVNDAFLVAECLQQHCGFEWDNISVLHDVYPGQKKSMKVDPGKMPTRANILHNLQGLVRSAKQGDVLFFSFSGYGLQVDDMDGYQDEGYDEAILPTDFVDGRDGDYTVIVADDVHDILMGVPGNCSVTVLMDCDHGTSIIDVSGTLDGKLVEGLKYHNFCGLKAHTAKMQLAAHNRDVWQEEKARAVKARPRFQPLMEIDNPRKGRLPTRPAMSRSTPLAFCFSAAGHGQTAVEMQMTTLSEGKEAQKQHGVLSWSFVRALEELRFDCTYTDLLMGIRRQFRAIREKDLPRMDQEVLMTYSTPLSNPSDMRVMVPAGVQRCQGLQGPMPVAVPAVIPPPAPGAVLGQGPPALGPSAGSWDRVGRTTNSAGAGAGGTGAAAGHDAEAGEAWPPLPPPPPPVPGAPQRCASQLVHHNVAPRGGGSFSVQGGAGGAPMQARGAWEPTREPSFEAATRPGEGRPLQPAVSAAAHEPPPYGREAPSGRPGEYGAPPAPGGMSYRPPGPQQSGGPEPLRDPSLDGMINGIGLEHPGAPHPVELGAFGFFAGPGRSPPAMPGGRQQAAPGPARPPPQPGPPPAPAPTKVPGLTPPNLFAGGSAPLGLSSSLGQSFNQMPAGAGMVGMHGPPAAAPPRWR